MEIYIGNHSLIYSDFLFTFWVLPVTQPTWETGENGMLRRTGEIVRKIAPRSDGTFLPGVFIQELKPNYGFYKEFRCNLLYFVHATEYCFLVELIIC